MLVRAIGANVGGRDRHLHRLHRAVRRARTRPRRPLLCCDVSEEWTSIARRYWEKAGVADRIELRIAPAIETLRALPADAPSTSPSSTPTRSRYRAYYEALLPRLRPNGLFVFDNVLWMGKVLDTQTPSDTRARCSAQRPHGRRRARRGVMISVSDGLTIVRKKASGE